LAAAFPDVGIGLAGVSLAFGLTVLTMAYAVGHISGAHFNPAVTVGLWAGKRFPASEILPYIVAQVVGAIAELKEIVPAALRSYYPTLKTWIITERELLDNWFSELRRYYSVEVDEYKTPSRPQPQQSIATPFTTLHLLPDAPPEVVKAAYKALAKIHHPDLRGDNEKMLEINRAFEAISQNR
jgi:hypothetical protein